MADRSFTRLMVVLALVAAEPARAVVSSATTTTSYACAGSGTAFSVPFRVLDQTHLVVTRTQGGATTTLARVTDYTVALTPTGGTVTLVSAARCPAGATLAIERVTPATQPSAFSTQGPFNPKAHESAFDRLTLVTQELAREDGRVREDFVGLETYVDGLAAGGAVTLPVSFALTGDGAATVFSVPGIDVSSATSYWVAVDGVLQKPTADYSLDATADTITFTSAPPLGAVIEVRSVTYSKAQSVNDNTTITATGSTTARTLRDRAADVLNAKDFGAKGDGATDDYAAIQAAFTAAAASGSDVVIPAGSYVLGAVPVLTAPANRRITVRASGAEFIPAAGVTGLRITGGSSTGGATVVGLRINHRGNATAVAGFDISQAWHAHLTDAWVEAHGVSGTYAAVLVRQSNATDPNTGSFWTRIDHLSVGKRSGGDAGNIAYGIILRGSANATLISGGSLANVTTGVSLQGDSETPGYLPNAVVVDGMAFEQFTTGIEIVGSASSNIAGPKFINNRFEAGTTAFSFTGTTAQPSSPPTMSGNYLTFGVAYINNPNGIFFNSYDAQITPYIPTQLHTDLAVQAATGSGFPITAQPLGGGRGYQLLTSGGTQAGVWTWTGTGNKTQIDAHTGGTANLSLTGVQSISGAAAGTGGNNLRGQVTVTGATTIGGWTFPTSEPDNAYFLSLTPTSSTGTPAAGSNRVLSVNKSGTPGLWFQVVTEVAPGVGNSVTFDWILIR